MSEASSDPTLPATSGREQRRLRNYLLDKRFQLKYAAYLAGIALVVAVLLGTGLGLTSTKLIEQSRHAVDQGQALVKQGQETVKRGQLVIEQNKKINQVVAMNIAEAYKDQPELAKQFGEDTARDEQKFKEEQERLEKDADFLKQRAAELEQQAKAVAEQQRTLITGLVVALALLVVCIWLAGIVVTHKIAGPVFKMKRMFRQVGDGKLALHERLRRGDEMQDFFETFDQMLGRLRERQESEIKHIDEAIAKLEAEPSSREGDSSAAGILKSLRKEMQRQVEG
jgi:nitrogen fixation/metabolism regulation signal transduction histidine kinase